jgi:ATP/maltotriose-dependent transcriptional regulator MalT
LFLSAHTIKAQMKSIYHKLDVSSRNQAVTRARELGLPEG